MLVLQSFFPNIKGIRTDLSLVRKQSRLSCGFLKKHGYSTVLFTTNELKEFVFNDVGYDDIFSIDKEEIRSVVDKNFWSGSKLLACSKIKEPYVHIDIDLFLVEDSLKDYLSKDFFSLHVEPWMRFHFGQIDQHQMLDLFGIALKDEQVYNFGVFGGQDHANTNACITKILSELPELKKKTSKLVAQIKAKGDWKESVFIEQFLLPKIIKERIGMKGELPTVVDGSLAKGFGCIFEELKKKSIIHLWVGKEHLDNHLGLNLILDMMERYYFGHNSGHDFDSKIIRPESIEEKSDIHDKIFENIAEIIGIEKDILTLETKFESLGADSLDMVEFSMAVEEEFGVSIEQSDIASIKTIGDAVEFIKKNKKAIMPR